VETRGISGKLGKPGIDGIDGIFTDKAGKLWYLTS
jgi:hypothetical protein